MELFHNSGIHTRLYHNSCLSYVLSSNTCNYHIFLPSTSLLAHNPSALSSFRIETCTGYYSMFFLHTCVCLMIFQNLNNGIILYSIFCIYVCAWWSSKTHDLSLSFLHSNSKIWFLIHTIPTRSLYSAWRLTMIWVHWIENNYDQRVPPHGEPCEDLRPSGATETSIRDICEYLQWKCAGECV